jgi:hypothetical protein
LTMAWRAQVTVPPSLPTTQVNSAELRPGSNCHHLNPSPVRVVMTLVSPWLGAPIGLKT